jgi:hypothetical protein
MLVKSSALAREWMTKFFTRVRWYWKTLGEMLGLLSMPIIAGITSGWLMKLSVEWRDHEMQTISTRLELLLAYLRISN